LKATGLAALMVRVGLHPPAEPGSAIGIFDPVLADVGDEQSIEESLSTFSAHMLHLDAILRAAKPGALVLLDEVATGTNPLEGDALAVAVVDELIERGATLIVTTHYVGLKAHASAMEALENAAMEFEPETLRPTFRLRVGTPGQSYAREVARKLGIDTKVLDRADRILHAAGGESRREADALLRTLETERERMKADREKLDARIAEVDARTQKAESHEAALAIREERLREKQVAEFSRTVTEAQDEIRAMINSLIEERSFDRLEKARDRLGEIQARVEKRAPRFDPATGEEAPPDLASLAPGDRVFLTRLGREAVVEDRAGDQVRVRAGGLQIRVDPKDIRRLGPKADDLAATKGGKPTKKSRKSKGEVRSTAPDDAHVLDLRGERAEDAVRRLERFLDDATLRGEREVRVIHGHGTGALKTEVRRYVKDSPYASQWRPGAAAEGGDGVTVVDLTD